MEKVIRDGKVAVLYSPGYGAGFYTWNDKHKELVFHPKLVEMVEANRHDELTSDWIKENLGLEGVYAGGCRSLSIEWLPEGTAFIIQEHDGYEEVEIFELQGLVA